MFLKFWMDILMKDLMLIIVLIEKKVLYFLFVFCIKKMKLVDMLGIFGGRSDMVDNNYIGVFFVIINVLML